MYEKLVNKELRYEEMVMYYVNRTVDGVDYFVKKQYGEDVSEFYGEEVGFKKVDPNRLD